MQCAMQNWQVRWFHPCIPRAKQLAGQMQKCCNRALFQKKCGSTAEREAERNRRSEAGKSIIGNCGFNCLFPLYCIAMQVVARHAIQYMGSLTAAWQLQLPLPKPPAPISTASSPAAIATQSRTHRK